MPSALIESVLDNWWYYSVELKPGVVTKGITSTQLPMLPRMILRDVDVTGRDCLDVGTMEGLMPAMMRRNGAARVLAVDAIDHCERKMAALKEAYDVAFDFRRVGLMYELSRKLADQGGFDLINFTGVNYHVFSPMHCLAGLRPLLKKNGLMIIGTNVVKRDGHTLEFNNAGRLQAESNTFWYHSVPMMEYLARYFQLVPIDALYFPHSPVNPATYVPGMDLGYLVMICRAVEEDQVPDGDEWAKRSRAQSWEFQGLCDRAMMNRQPWSEIGYRSARVPTEAPAGIELLRTIQQPEHVVAQASDLRDTHTLMLDHQS
jgi:2-polyprenyl-3-methyl-5-hydroxy-6-metoxy-1,4-benzoquinol methylase